MSRKDELLKLAELFHLQASRREHPPQNRRCVEWANTTNTKLPMRWIAAVNDIGVSSS